MTLDLAWQFFLNGLATGGLYALLAVGLIIAYRASGYLNFCHPYVGMVAAFAYVISQPRIGALPAVVLAIAIGAALAAGLYQGIFRRLVDEPLSAKVVVALAMGIGLQVVGGVLLLNFDLLGSSFGSLFEDGESISILGASITYQQAALPIVGIVVIAGVMFLFQRTDFGLALRATAQNPLSAGLAGIPARLVEVGAWALTGALAALTGVLWLSSTSFLVPTFLFEESIRGFIAALAGGFVDFKRAVIAAFAVGILEQELIGAPEPWNQFPGAVAFGLLTVVALFGLTNQSTVERAE